MDGASRGRARGSGRRGGDHGEHRESPVLYPRTHTGRLATAPAHARPYTSVCTRPYTSMCTYTPTHTSMCTRPLIHIHVYTSVM